MNESISKDMLDVIELLKNGKSITVAAKAINKPIFSVIIKLSRLGLINSGVPRSKRAIPLGAGLNKKQVKKLVSDLSKYKKNFVSFCRMNGFSPQVLAKAFEINESKFWTTYLIKHSMQMVNCDYCNDTFLPVFRRGKTILMCGERCRRLAKQDEDYFGGRRRFTLGMADGICQLCMNKKYKGLSSHHVLGKANDPNNECLIALCMGCHELITRLSIRKFLQTEVGWESLIALCMARYYAEISNKSIVVDPKVNFTTMTIDQIGMTST